MAGELNQQEGLDSYEGNQFIYLAFQKYAGSYIFRKSLCHQENFLFTLFSEKIFKSFTHRFQGQKDYIHYTQNNSMIPVKLC